MTRVKITKDNIEKIRNELQDHMRSLTLMQEQLQEKFVRQLLAPKEK